jgi:hypothetical protein
MCGVDGCPLRHPVQWVCFNSWMKLRSISASPLNSGLGCDPGVGGGALRRAGSYGRDRDERLAVACMEASARTSL